MVFALYGGSDVLIWDLIVEDKGVPATECTTNSKYFKTLPSNNQEYISCHLAVEEKQINESDLSF